MATPEKDRAKRRMLANIQNAVYLHFINSPEVSFEKMAKKIGKTEDDIRKQFGNTDKWRLDDVSDLMMAMGAELEFRLNDPDDFGARFSDTETERGGSYANP